jgi:hypothetical protein
VGAIESAARRLLVSSPATRGWGRSTTSAYGTLRSPIRGASDALRGLGFRVVTWLILPVVICLSQRLSHACLSISNYTVKLRMAH